MSWLRALLKILTVFQVMCLEPNGNGSNTISFFETPSKSHAIMIMDFAENIKFQFSEETIAFHSKAYSSTLFSIGIYRHSGDKGFVLENINIVSNDLKHDSHAVHNFTQVALSHITRKYSEKKSHTYTDSLTVVPTIC